MEGEEEDKEQELALRYAVDRINNNNAILPSTRVQLLTRRLPAGDNFHVSKAGRSRKLVLCLVSQSFCDMKDTKLLSIWNFVPENYFPQRERDIAKTYHPRKRTRNMDVECLFFVCVYA